MNSFVVDLPIVQQPPVSKVIQLPPEEEEEEESSVKVMLRRRGRPRIRVSHRGKTLRLTNRNLRIKNRGRVKSVHPSDDESGDGMFKIEKCT